MPSRAAVQVIVVGGGGTLGSSTALHLVRAGYTPAHITVLDTYPFPSAQAAGNDLNKIMGIRLRHPVDLQLSLEAAAMWKQDDLLKPFFHNTGRVCIPMYYIITVLLYIHMFTYVQNIWEYCADEIYTSTSRWTVKCPSMAWRPSAGNMRSSSRPVWGPRTSGWTMRTKSWTRCLCYHVRISRYVILPLFEVITLITWQFTITKRRTGMESTLQSRRRLAGRCQGHQRHWRVLSGPRGPVWVRPVRLRLSFFFMYEYLLK